MLELGGERGLAQRLPGHGGDPRDVGPVVGPLVGTAVGRTAGTSRAPRRVRGAEQPGGPARLSAECPRAGQAGERLRHHLRVTELLRGGEAPEMP